MYCDYLSQSPGSCCNISALIIAVIPFLILGYLRLFISSWTSLPFNEQEDSEKKTQFTFISLITIIVAGFTGFLIGAIFVHLSHSLHNSMLERVAHAPMHFFNSNPLGRIINRFSKDTAMADSVVTFFLIQWIQVRQL